METILFFNWLGIKKKNLKKNKANGIMLQLSSGLNSVLHFGR